MISQHHLGCFSFCFGCFEFADLSKIDQADIFFPEGSTVETLVFSWMSFNTLYPDFIENNYKVESWGVSYCESLEEIILPDQEGFTFSVSSCANIKSLIVPESITAFKQSTFWGNDKTITDVYYGGSKSQFNNIKTLVWDDETKEYIISDVPFKSYFGKATIHYFYGKSDWVQADDGTWSYVDDSGELLTGWNKIDGVWYYFDEDGIMLKNWQKIKEKWYYLGSNGAMRTGWQRFGNDWYYLGNSGSMVTGTQTIGGVTYEFDDITGVWVG